MSFFNGANTAEITGLMKSETKAVTPYPFIKTMAAQQPFWDAVEPHLNSDKEGLDFQLDLVNAVLELDGTLVPKFSLDAVYKATIKVINQGNKKVSESHGLNSQQKIVGSKIKTVLLLAKQESSTQTVSA